MKHSGQIFRHRPCLAQARDFSSETTTTSFITQRMGKRLEGLSRQVDRRSHQSPRAWHISRSWAKTAADLNEGHSASPSVCGSSPGPCSSAGWSASPLIRLPGRSTRTSSSGKICQATAKSSVRRSTPRSAPRRRISGSQGPRPRRT